MCKISAGFHWVLSHLKPPLRHLIWGGQGSPLRENHFEGVWLEELSCGCFFSKPFCWWYTFIQLSWWEGGSLVQGFWKVEAQTIIILMAWAHPRATEAKTVGLGSSSLVYQGLQVILVLAKVWEPCSRYLVYRHLATVSHGPGQKGPQDISPSPPWSHRKLTTWHYKPRPGIWHKEGLVLIASGGWHRFSCCWV